MDSTIFGLNSTAISFIQLIVSLIGGGCAIYLFWRSNNEKKRTYISGIFDKLYGDDDIKTILYAADKHKGLEQLHEKLKRLENQIQPSEINEVNLERQTDKTLRYLDFIGELIKERHLHIEDLNPFRYEIKKILDDEIIAKYIRYLKSIGVNFENLDRLKKYLDK